MTDWLRWQDFTEVDKNVTRHIPSELVREDWNGMVMHYLGLDHIGHKTGPKGCVPSWLWLNHVLHLLTTGQPQHDTQADRNGWCSTTHLRSYRD